MYENNYFSTTTVKRKHNKAGLRNIIMNTPVEEIEIVEATKEDHWKLFNFLITSYPDFGWSKEFMEWQYYLNPAGTARSWIAKHDGNVIANYTAIPHKLYVNGKLELSWRVQDVITHPDYRGMGLYSKLSDAANNVLQSEDFPVNFTFPNEKSHQGFIKLNWLNPNRIPLWILHKPQKIKNERISLHIEPILKFTKTDESIWNSYRQKLHYALERSANYLNWRYTQKPRGGYFPFRLTDGAKSAICVFKIYNNGLGEKFSHLIDCFYEDGFKQVEDIILYFIDYSKKQEATLASAWSQPKSEIAHYMNKHAFELNEHITRWFVLNINSTNLDKDEVCEFSHWHISMGDTDVF
ncbi:MAG: GNAT family N-acetyltransferase [Planctomycetota bacterium]